MRCSSINQSHYHYVILEKMYVNGKVRLRQESTLEKFGDTFGKHHVYLASGTPYCRMCSIKLSSKACSYAARDAIATPRGVCNEIAAQSIIY